jgi:hypothetical protein
VKFRDTMFVARVSITQFWGVNQSTPWTTPTDQCVVGDVDGDLRDDLVCLKASVLHTARSKGAVGSRTSST